MKLLTFILVLLIACITAESPVENIAMRYWAKLKEDSSIKFRSTKRSMDDFLNSPSSAWYYADTKCTHDEFIGNMDYKANLDNVRSLDTSSLTFKKRIITDWANIRIYLNTSLLDNDPYACITEGQVVPLEEPYYDDTSSTVVTQMTCSGDFMLTSDKVNILQKYVLPAVMEVIQSTFMVQPVVGNFFLDPNYENTTSQCRMGLSPSPDLLPPGPGLPDTDYVLYVSARPVFNTEIMANAIPCSHDLLPGGKVSRPIAGSINFNTGAQVLIDCASDMSNPFLFLQVLKLGVHEVIHALGFTSSLYSDYVNTTTGTFYDNPWGPLERIDQGPNAPVLYKVITPRVLAYAQEHYICPDMLGVELEESDSPGYPGSHWEKRIIGSEFMAPTVNHVSPISNLTLFWMEDSGWYKVNHTTAEQWRWGWQKGCDFVMGKCQNWTTDYFCSVSAAEACDPERYAKSSCNLYTYSPLEPYYEHYSDPTLGGSPQPDYCGTYQGYLNYFCSDPRGYDVVGSNNYYLEDFGSNCRCFDVAKSDGSPNTGCYEYKCIISPKTNDSILAIKLADKWYGCPETADPVIYATLGDNLVDQRKVTVKCPEYGFFCEGVTAVAWELNEATTGYYSAWLLLGLLIINIIVQFHN